MTEAEKWSGSRVLFDTWCPRDAGYFLAPMLTPLAMWLGPSPFLVNFTSPFIVLHPLTDPAPVMAAHVAEAYMSDGLGVWQ